MVVLRKELEEMRDGSNGRFVLYVSAAFPLGSDVTTAVNQ